MMRITWKRALSALLTVCMIASLLVVPAAAANHSDATHWATFAKDGGSDSAVATGGTANFFTPHTSSSETTSPGKSQLKTGHEAGSVSIDGDTVSWSAYNSTTASCGGGLKFNSSARISFTNTKPGTLKVVILLRTPSDSAVASIQVDGGDEISSEGNVVETKITTTGKHTVQNGSAGEATVMYISWTDDDVTTPPAFSADQGNLNEDNNVVSFTLSNADSTATYTLYSDAECQTAVENCTSAVSDNTLTFTSTSTLTAGDYYVTATVSGKESVGTVVHVLANGAKQTRQLTLALTDCTATVKVGEGEAQAYTEAMQVEIEAPLVITFTANNRYLMPQTANKQGSWGDTDTYSCAEDQKTATLTVTMTEGDKTFTIAATGPNSVNAVPSSSDIGEGKTYGAAETWNASDIESDSTLYADSKVAPSAETAVTASALQHIAVSIAPQSDGYTYAGSGTKTTSSASNIQYTGSLQGKTNPTITDNVPSAGGYYKFVPTVDGVLEIAGKGAGGATKHVVVSSNEASDSAFAEMDEYTLASDTNAAIFTVVNVKADKTYYYYVSGGSKAVLYGITFWPKNAPAATEYDVTVASATNGTVSVDKTKAAENAEVTITATASEGYEVDTITVTKDSDSSAVTVTGNKFTMPGEAVTVTVTFKTATVTPTVPTGPWTFTESFENGTGVSYNGLTLDNATYHNNILALLQAGSKISIPVAGACDVKVTYNYDANATVGVDGGTSIWTNKSAGVGITGSVGTFPVATYHYAGTGAGTVVITAKGTTYVEKIEVLAATTATKTLEVSQTEDVAMAAIGETKDVYTVVQHGTSTDTITVTSGTPAVATVSALENGKFTITAVSGGSSVITVSGNGETKTFNVTVTEIPLGNPTVGTVYNAITATPARTEGFAWTGFTYSNSHGMQAGSGAEFTVNLKSDKDYTVLIEICGYSSGNASEINVKGEAVDTTKRVALDTDNVLVANHNSTGVLWTFEGLKGEQTFQMKDGQYIHAIKVVESIKTMTLSAAAVTKTYNGQAATITVSGAPDSATITYCLTEDGTYTETQPEMKNAGDYTVYFKATAEGYKDAAASTTVKINKATPTITVTADLTDDIPSEGGSVTFKATGVPADSATVLTGLCDQSTHGSFNFSMVNGELVGVNAVAANESETAKTHTVSFTWAGDNNYNAATIADVVLSQVGKGQVGATPATGLAVDNKFADKGVTATAANGVSITIDEAAILAAFNADKTAFQGNAVQHGNDAYIMVTFDAPEGFDKTTWKVQQLVNSVASSTAPWALDGSDSSNELDVVGTKIGDWFCILKGVNGDAPTMPAEGTYRMSYRFYDGSDTLVAIYTYTVTRAVTPAQKIVPLVHIFDAEKSTAAVTAIGDAATVTTGGDVDASGFFVAKSSNNPVSGINTDTDLPYLLKGTALDKGCAKMTNTARSLSFAAPAAGTMKLYFLNITNADAVSIDNGVGEKAVPVGYSAVTFATTAQTYTITPVVKDPEGLPFLFAVVWTPDGATACTHDAAKLVKTEQNVGADTGKVWAYCNDDPMCFEMVQVDAPAPTEFDVILEADPAKGNVSVDKTKAAEGAQVTITAIAGDGYEVDAITVTKASGGSVSVTGNKFTMPAETVTVTVTFKTATVTPPAVVKDELNAAITAAQAVDTTDVVVSVDGTDVITSEKWIAKSVKDAFDAALTDAKTVAGKTNATQTEVDEAKETLTAATTALTEAIANAQNGTKVVTKAELTAAIEKANTAADAITVATAASEVSKGTKWVTAAVQEAYKAAIAAAQEVADKEDADADELAEALAALNQAGRTFEAAKQDGSKSTSKPGSRPSGTTTPDTTVTTKNETLTDGTNRVTATASDGTVTVTDTQPNGTKAVTTTTPAGEITTQVTLGRGNESAKVTVPVENAESGMVAIIVDADGKETIIRDSVVVDDDLIFELDKDAKVKIVNRAKSFVDVTNHWAKSDVDFVSARELFNGVDATHFAPDTSMTRGMMATVLFRLNGEIKGEQGGDFTDVVSNDWFANAVDWAADAGIINGYTNGSFGPNRSVTREELVVMIYRYAGAPAVDGNELSDFADGDVVANWAAAAMTWAIQNKIIQGRGGSMIDPKGNATRAEVSAVLQRYVRLAK